MAEQRYNKDTFTDVVMALMKFDPNDAATKTIIDEFWGAYDTKYKGEVSVDLIPDLVVGSGQAPTFDKKYATYLDIRKRDASTLGITSIADYNASKAEYKNLFGQFNLKELATDENIDKFLSGEVSAREAAMRLDAAYNAVKFADSTLKEQLKGYGLEDKDLAKALLLGKDGAAELQDKIKVAEIKAAEKQAGIKSTIGAEELARLGVSRGQAMQGLSDVAGTKAKYEAAGARAGIDAQDIQKDLEQENLLGLKSQRRAKIATAETNLFRKSTGAGSIGLKGAGKGKF